MSHNYNVWFNHADHGPPTQLHIQKASYEERKKEEDESDIKMGDFVPSDVSCNWTCYVGICTDFLWRKCQDDICDLSYGCPFYGF